jgi:hypothetical protein
VPLTFKDDIRPLFRDDPDVSCMARAGVRLDDSTWMCNPQNALKVYDAVASQKMPPSLPWPRDRAERFKTWMDEGCLP